MLPTLSVTVLLIVICKSEYGKECLPYFGMACGFFGRLHTKGNSSLDLFDEISELNLLAHRKGKADGTSHPRSSVEALSGDKASNMVFSPTQMLGTGKRDVDSLDFAQDVPSIFDIYCLDDHR